MKSVAYESSFDGELDRQKELFSFLADLSGPYPLFAVWYWNKVVPGLADGTRYMVCVREGDRVIGAGIAKKDRLETKLCTVRIDTSFEGRGTGMRIFDKLMLWLDCDQPHLTVSELSLPKFRRIFEWYGFVHTSTQFDRYVPGVAELGFNDTFVSSTLCRTSLFTAATTDKGMRSALEYPLQTSSAIL
jgi:hypothetical protein